jgi:hypothetical protein
MLGDLFVRVDTFCLYYPRLHWRSRWLESQVIIEKEDIASELSEEGLLDILQED